MVGRKSFIKQYIENILKEHFDILISQLEQRSIDFENLEDILLSTIYEYVAIIDYQLYLKYKRIKIKEKPIIQRLKKKRNGV